jgi:hypothetical protein
MPSLQRNRPIVQGTGYAGLVTGHLNDSLTTPYVHVLTLDVSDEPESSHPGLRDFKSLSYAQGVQQKVDLFLELLEKINSFIS